MTQVPRFHSSTVPRSVPLAALVTSPISNHGSGDFLAGHWVVEVQSRALNIFVDRVDPADHGKHVFFRDVK